MIYFIQSEDGPIKIGVSNDPEERLDSLRGANPYPLNLVGVMRGDEVTEAGLHQRFWDLRMPGGAEWFCASDELLAFIDEAVKDTILNYIEAPIGMYEFWREYKVEYTSRVCHMIQSRERWNKQQGIAEEKPQMSFWEWCQSPSNGG